MRFQKTRLHLDARESKQKLINNVFTVPEVEKLASKSDSVQTLTTGGKVPIEARKIKASLLNHPRISELLPFYHGTR